MIICVKCKKEMQCIRTGLGARWHEQHTYPGDAFACPGCDFQIINTLGNPTVDGDSPALSMTDEFHYRIIPAEAGEPARSPRLEKLD